MRAIERFLFRRPRFGVLLNRAAGLLAFAIAAVIVAEIFVPSASQATLPVIDVAAVGQLVQQTEQYAQSLERMTEQILLLKQQVQSLTGHYGYGALGSPVNAWGGASWQDIINMVNTGTNPGDAAQVAAYQAAKAQNLAQFPMLAASLRSVNPRTNATYDVTYQSAMAGMSAGQGTFDSLKTQLAELQILKDKIEQTTTVKAAIDLNTAVAVKQAEINAEILRTHAMALYLAGNAQNGLTSGQAAESEFFSN